MIIVEDLETDQRKLADLIRQDSASHEESVDLSFYASGEDFLAHYRPKSCDGLLLDILLGGMNGIEAARRVPTAGWRTAWTDTPEAVPYTGRPSPAAMV